MSAESTVATPEPKGRRKPERTPKDGPRVRGGTAEARNQAALILEVLAGVRRPLEAAKALNIPLPRYYLLERRALEGFVTGCEPAPLGRKPGADARELEKAQKQLRRLEQDCLRYQALARTAQRGLGLPPVPPPSREVVKGKRRSKPAVRALKVALGLKKETAPAETASIPQL